MTERESMVGKHGKTPLGCAIPIAFFLAWIISIAPAVVSYGTSLDPGLEELAEARRELEISKATEARIATELERLKDSGEASSDMIRDYEAYLDRVRQMVVIQRQIVADMESAYLEHTSSHAVTKEASDSGDKAARSDPPGEDPHDKLAHLDRELDESLAAFDDVLLREMEAIRLRRSDEMRDLAQEAAAAAQRLRDKGLHVDTSTPPGEGEGASQTGEVGPDDPPASRAEPSTETAGGPGGEDRDNQDAGDRSEGGVRAPEGGAVGGGAKTAEGGGGSKGEGSGQTQTQPDKPAVYDDDIVARQLREAAERETDPKLKKKLWEEYETYKRGTAQ